MELTDAGTLDEDMKKQAYVRFCGLKILSKKTNEAIYQTII